MAGIALAALRGCLLLAGAEAALWTLAADHSGCANWKELQIGRTTSETDQDACGSRCKDQPGCVGFNYARCQAGTSKSGECMLFRGQCRSEHRKCWDDYTMDGRVPESPPDADERALSSGKPSGAGWELAARGTGCANWMDLQVGGSTVESDADACGKRCDAHAGCVGFNFARCESSTSVPGKCMLLSGVCTPEASKCWDDYRMKDAAIEQPLPSLSLGGPAVTEERNRSLLARPAPKKELAISTTATTATFLVQHGTGCHNWEDIILGKPSVVDTAAACGSLCQEHPGCKGFNFATCASGGSKKGECMLFQGPCNAGASKCWDEYAMQAEAVGVELSTERDHQAAAWFVREGSAGCRNWAEILLGSPSTESGPSACGARCKAHHGCVAFNYLKDTSSCDGAHGGQEVGGCMLYSAPCHIQANTCWDIYTAQDQAPSSPTPASSAPAPSKATPVSTPSAIIAREGALGAGWKLLRHGHGCKNWADMQLGERYVMDAASECGSRCKELDVCTGFMFQTIDTCSSGGNKKGTCVLTAGSCDYAWNNCWDVYAMVTRSTTSTAQSTTSTAPSQHPSREGAELSGSVALEASRPHAFAADRGCAEAFRKAIAAAAGVAPSTASVHLMSSSLAKANQSRGPVLAEYVVRIQDAKPGFADQVQEALEAMSAKGLQAGIVKNLAALGNQSGVAAYSPQVGKISEPAVYTPAVHVSENKSLFNKVVTDSDANASSRHMEDGVRFPLAHAQGNHSLRMASAQGAKLGDSHPTGQLALTVTTASLAATGSTLFFAGWLAIKGCDRKSIIPEWVQASAASSDRKLMRREAFSSPTGKGGGSPSYRRNDSPSGHPLL